MSEKDVKGNEPVSQYQITNPAFQKEYIMFNKSSCFKKKKKVTVKFKSTLF